LVGGVIGRYHREQVGGQLRGVFGRDRLCLDLGGVIEGDAGDREQQQADQADRRTHPVPGVELLQPEGTAALLPVARLGHGFSLAYARI
jgi:hypothetical protein